MADFDPNDPKCIAGVEAALHRMRAGHAEEDIRAALLPKPPTLREAAKALVYFSTVCPLCGFADSKHRENCLIGSVKAALQREGPTDD